MSHRCIKLAVVESTQEVDLSFFPLTHCFYWAFIFSQSVVRNFYTDNNNNEKWLTHSKQINIALSFSVTDEWLRNKDWTSHPQISFNNRRSLYKHLSWQCGSDAFCLCSMHFVCWPRFQWNSANVWRAVFETCELFMCLKCLSWVCTSWLSGWCDLDVLADQNQTDWVTSSWA